MPTNASAKKARPSKDFPLTNEIMLLYTMLALQEDLKVNFQVFICGNIMLMLFHKHDWDEIAEKLGIKVGAARKRWERTRNSIIERTKDPEAQASEQAPTEDEE